jgi:ABC-type transport system involved in multi-copper enzyme maturation permease subunit
MNWLIWKQQGKQFTILGILLALYAGLAILIGAHLWHTYQHALTACSATDTCNELKARLLSGWELSLNPSPGAGEFNIVTLLILLIPLLLGVFMGVPLIAREYNDKTNLLVWTRSVSRRKWLTMKLIWTLAIAAVFAGAFAALTTWWSRTGNALYIDRFDVGRFNIQGVVPIAYTIFAVLLGIALGTWLKRTMAAIGLTLLLVLVVQVTVSALVRPHFMSPQERSIAITQNTIPGDDSSLALSPQAPPDSGASWITGGGLVDNTGHAFNWSNPPGSCIVADLHQENRRAPVDASDPILSRGDGPPVSLRCLGELGYKWSTMYQPASRYWSFQWLEFGLYSILSLIPLAATYWLVLHRDA